MSRNVGNGKSDHFTEVSPMVNYSMIMDSTRNTKYQEMQEMRKVIILLRVPHSKLFEDHGFDKNREMSRNVGNDKSDNFTEGSPLVNYSRLIESTRIAKCQEMQEMTKV